MNRAVRVKSAEGATLAPPGPGADYMTPLNQLEILRQNALARNTLLTQGATQGGRNVGGLFGGGAGGLAGLLAGLKAFKGSGFKGRGLAGLLGSLAGGGVGGGLGRWAGGRLGAGMAPQLKPALTAPVTTESSPEVISALANLGKQSAWHTKEAINLNWLKPLAKPIMPFFTKAAPAIASAAPAIASAAEGAAPAATQATAGLMRGGFSPLRAMGTVWGATELGLPLANRFAGTNLHGPVGAWMQSQAQMSPTTGINPFTWGWSPAEQRQRAWDTAAAGFKSHGDELNQKIDEAMVAGKDTTDLENQLKNQTGGPGMLSRLFPWSGYNMGQYGETLRGMADSDRALRDRIQARMDQRGALMSEPAKAALQTQLDQIKLRMSQAGNDPRTEGGIPGLYSNVEGGTPATGPAGPGATTLTPQQQALIQNALTDKTGLSGRAGRVNIWSDIPTAEGSSYNFQ